MILQTTNAFVWRRERTRLEGIEAKQCKRNKLQVSSLAERYAGHHLVLTGSTLTSIASDTDKRPDLSKTTSQA